MTITTIEEIDYQKVFENIAARLVKESPSQSTSIVAKFICSCYWGEKLGFLFDLKTLSSLDERNFENCMLIAHYRRTRGWSDEKFYELAKFAKTCI